MEKKQEFNYNEFTSKFDELVSEEKMNINTLEQIMMDDVEKYKKGLKVHAEELLATHINEKKLISKKNRNGEKKDTN